ncbi:PEP-utilizing enzyme [Lentzea xinjiangensis]|nr:PEP-utilizing enzyme [Lentzea xinjiangensis]
MEERIFFDATKVLRSGVGRKFITRLLAVMEARSSEVLRGLFDDPRFAVTSSSPVSVIRRVLRLARRFRAPATVAKALVNPEKAVRDAMLMEREILERSASLSIEQALRQCVVPVLPRLAPTALVGFAVLGLVGEVVRVRPGELQAVPRGLPNNVTTEMDMAMWDVARQIRRDPVALRQFQDGGRTVTGIARAVVDPNGAHLEPGEILVAPSTDPGWTPLFLTASALVMEMGGASSHGAVVAREYGIPAVVGVRGAVTRIRTGERITVDGGTGVITTPEIGS